MRTSIKLPSLLKKFSPILCFLLIGFVVNAQDAPKAPEETDRSGEGEVEVRKGESRRRPVIDTLTYETQPGLPMAASKIYFSDKKFTVSGFGELAYTNYLGPKDVQSGDIELYMTNLYRFVSYMAYKPKDWLVLYGEIFAEYFQDWGHEADHEIFIEAFADFLIDRRFNLRVGTHQVQLGYVNNNDEPIQIFSVNRPDVERIIIPSQWIDLGIMTYGAINNDLSYTFSVYQGLDANNLRGGTWIRGGRANALRFNFNSYILNSQLNYTGIKNTTLSASGIYTRVGDGEEVAMNGGLAPVTANTALVSGYSRTELKRWTIMMLGTYGRMGQTDRIEALTGEVLGNSVYGGYLEVGYDLMPFFKRRNGERTRTMLYRSDEVRMPVFARYERLNTHRAIHPDLLRPEHEVFASDLHTLTVGLNFNPRRNIVVKGNYQFRYNRIPLSTGEREGNRVEIGAGFIF
ncbi:hypothetical protein RCC89_07205 [Cytophagaceae bacterium ABcell3]|nr:hypothetical protein RCC89_07205 [Cytophagaceae bacterium ABcell3]